MQTHPKITVKFEDLQHQLEVKKWPDISSGVNPSRHPMVTPVIDPVSLAAAFRDEQLSHTCVRSHPPDSPHP